MMIHVGCYLFSLIFLMNSMNTIESQNNVDSKGKLVWSDDFNQDALDTTKWTAIIGDGCPYNCGFGNNELQYYTNHPTNLKVSKGSVKLIATNDSLGNRAYSSVKLVTKSKGDWKYGRLEVKAKLPQGTGTWPAIWMLPTLDRPMKWPQDGEIDIMEHVGYNQGMVYGTIHTGKFNHVIGTQKSDSIYLKDAHEQFHVYAIDWSEERIVWLVDDEEFFTLARNGEEYDGWPFDQQFHLIVNLAVGGNWGGKHGVDDKIWPQMMEIDYVRVFQQL